MRTITSKIVNALNEAIDNDQLVEAEPTTGVNVPKQVHQCDNCAEFYLVSEVTNESVCPHCGGSGKPVAMVKEGIDPEENCTSDEISSKTIIDEEEEEELKSEAEEIVEEALHCLDLNDYKKFNECYRPRVRMTKKGELQGLVESKNGHPVTVSRRMTSRQKTAYNLSENYRPAVVTANNKKVESIRTSRQTLMMKNESRAIKLAACRLLERQGAKYDFKKFNEGMDKFLKGRNIRRMLEEISEEEIGKSEIDQMTPDEIGDTVTSIVKDTGLEVVSNDVDIDGDTATVNIRVKDDDEQEVRTSEVEDTLKDVFDAPVEIVGPYVSEGDKTLSDIAVVINPDNEGVKESVDAEIDPESNGADLQIHEEDEEPVRNPENGHKFESYRRRKRYIVKESYRPMFALKLNESTEEDPKFLAQDDSLVEGDDEDAEDKARLFVSEEAADKFLEDAGLEDEFTPRSISITDESMESEDDKEEEITEEGAEDVIETEDGKFYKKDECFYKESLEDGSVEEIDQSEYEDAKAEADAEELKEAYRRKRRRR